MVNQSDIIRQQINHGRDWIANAREHATGEVEWLLSRALFLLQDAEVMRRRQIEALPNPLPTERPNICPAGA